MEKVMSVVTGEKAQSQELRFVRDNAIQAAALFPNFKVNEAEVENKIMAQSRDYGHLYDASLGERLAGEVAADNTEWTGKFGTWIEQMSGRAPQFEKNAHLAPVVNDILSTLGVQEQSYEFLITEYANNRDNMNVFISKMSHLPDLENRLPIVQEMCKWLYGQEMIPKIIAQVVDLEGRINTANVGTETVDKEKGSVDTTKLAALAKEISDGSKTPGDDTIAMLAQAEVFAQAGAAAPKSDGTEGMADLTHAKNEKKGLGDDAELLKYAVHTGDGQTVPGDETFAGGDCYGTWKEFGPPPEMLKERGWLYLISDTASKGGDAADTKAFKAAFYRHFYSPDEPFSPPPHVHAENAFKAALSEVQPTCTLAYALISQDAAGKKIADVASIGSDRIFAVNTETNKFDPLTEPHSKVQVKDEGGAMKEATIMASDFRRTDLGNADTTLHKTHVGEIQDNVKIILMTDGFQGPPTSLEKLPELMTDDDCTCLIIDPNKLKLP